MNEQEPAAPVSGGGGFLRIRMDLSYDGGPFSGWAVQPGLRTVQGCLESALELVIRRPVRVTVAGRTDAGVHARGQVVHVDLSEEEWSTDAGVHARGQVVHVDLSEEEWSRLSRGGLYEPAAALQRKLRGALSRVLEGHHGAIEIHDAGLAPSGFDARFSALWRRYSYRIADGPQRWDPLLRGLTLWHKASLDTGLMNQGAALLLGLQDFRAYCRPREGATTLRELQRFEFVRAEDGVIVATVQADAFCHNMVRALVGGALRVGEGLETPQWMHDRMLAGVRDAKSVLAAPHPLVLEQVAYPAEGELLARAELTRAKRE